MNIIYIQFSCDQNLYNNLMKILFYLDVRLEVSKDLENLTTSKSCWTALVDRVNDMTTVSLLLLLLLLLGYYIIYLVLINIAHIYSYYSTPIDLLYIRNNAH